MRTLLGPRIIGLVPESNPTLKREPFFLPLRAGYGRALIHECSNGLFRMPDDHGGVGRTRGLGRRR